MKIYTFKRGGVHPPQMKTAPAGVIIDAGLPLSVSIPLQQHIGAEAKPIVAVGDHVARGQKIAEPGGRISACVHASISGTVKAIGTVRTATGQLCSAITIAASETDHEADLQERGRAKERPYTDLEPKEIISIIADSGIVGMGGATFPAAVKLCPPPGSKAEVLIINGAECEPCLTCDDALMQTHAREVVEGVKIMLKASGAPRALIGIETNKPRAIECMEAACQDDSRITVCRLKPKYPQGGEKQLISALTGRDVPSGALPIAVGAIVQNVATAYAVYCAVALGQPLIERVVTVAGAGNYLAPIGMAIADLPVEGISAASEADVIAGGPMMGHSAITMDAPITKGLSGISIVAPLPYSPEPCIRCGECSAACPMGLEPYLLATCGRLNQTQMAREHYAMDCIECGCCSYSCPSARPILDFIKLAKKRIRQELAAK